MLRNFMPIIMLPMFMPIMQIYVIFYVFTRDDVILFDDVVDVDVDVDGS